MEALRRLLLYAQMSREEYKACLPDIQRSNRHRVTAYLGIACGFLAVLWILSGVLEFLQPNMLAYMIALAVCMGLQAVNRAFPKKNGLLLTWLMYAFEALLYVLGIAETDLNVGLKNRNAYESQMHDYPMHCSSTLSCVYLDVNGLHELNNTRGHAAGDEMLKTVAAKVRDIFGEEYSYRVGGDEFVAFAMDKSAEEMRALIHKLVQEVDEAGYSVAVGTATHSAGGIDMEVLVKSAETRMYLAKEEHYRLAGKTRE